MKIPVRDFIIARPGYNEKYKRDVTWDELRRTFLLYKRIPMIVAAGDTKRHHLPIDPNDAIGFVDIKIDDDSQMIRGDDPVVYDEKIEALPADLQQKLINKEFIHASLGYEPFENIRKVDHILIGANRPVFEDIGFHAEEDNAFYYEETEGINKEEPAKDPEEPKLNYISREDFDKFQKEIFDRLDALKPQEAVTETVEEATEEEEEPVPEAEPPAPQTKPLVESSRIIPKEQPKNVTSDGMFVLDGMKVISSPLGKKDGADNERK